MVLLLLKLLLLLMLMLGWLLQDEDMDESERQSARLSNLVAKGHAFAQSAYELVQARADQPGPVGTKHAEEAIKAAGDEDVRMAAFQSVRKKEVSVVGSSCNHCLALVIAFPQALIPPDLPLCGACSTSRAWAPRSSLGGRSRRAARGRPQLLVHRAGRREGRPRRRLQVRVISPNSRRKWGSSPTACSSC